MRTSDSNSGIDLLFARDDFPGCVSEASVSREISPYGRTEYRKTPWWLWWNVLALDAPIVAVVWAALFARASGMKLSAAEAIALVLSVWIIYLSDRLLDGYRARNRATLQDRHLICERHRSAMVFLILAAGAAVLWIISNRLQAGEIAAGVKLGIILILYMAGIHSGYGRLAGSFRRRYRSGCCLRWERLCLSGRWGCDLREMDTCLGCFSVHCVASIVCPSSVGKIITPSRDGFSRLIRWCAGPTPESI